MRIFDTTFKPLCFKSYTAQSKFNNKIEIHSSLLQLPTDIADHSRPMFVEIIDNYLKNPKLNASFGLICENLRFM